MKVAIMQPTYLPWLGYFHLMAHADCFVLLDDAQFSKQSWHNRNRILVRGEEHTLTVSLQRPPLGTPLNAVSVNYGKDWVKSHIGQLRAAYAKALYGPPLVADVERLLKERPERLLDVTVPILCKLAEKLGLKTPMVLASKLDIPGVRSERLLQICRRLGATDYLSPAGAEAYLLEDRFMDQGDVRLWIQRFVPQPYEQPGTSTFIPYLSAIDLLAHHGPDVAAQHLAPWQFQEASRP